MASKFERRFVLQMRHIINIVVDDTHNLCKIRVSEKSLADLPMQKHCLLAVDLTCNVKYVNNSCQEVIIAD